MQGDIKDRKERIQSSSRAGREQKTKVPTVRRKTGPLRHAHINIDIPELAKNENDTPTTSKEIYHVQNKVFLFFLYIKEKNQEKYYGEILCHSTQTAERSVTRPLSLSLPEYPLSLPESPVSLLSPPLSLPLSPLSHLAQEGPKFWRMIRLLFVARGSPRSRRIWCRQCLAGIREGRNDHNNREGIHN
jgi:hypothetical protein